MTQKEKQLLLKDLCARLPYGVKVKLLCRGPEPKFDDWIEATLNTRDIEHFGKTFKNIKPYLRPVSSMTEEEWKNFRRTLDGGDCEINDDGETDFIMLWFEPCQLKSAYNCLDYLNSIHIDYRGLIPMGLAIEAPEGMYNLKEK